MTFDTIVFGSFAVGTGFTDGGSISSGGLRVFVKPTANIGNAPLDVGITYVDQFGNPAEPTTVTTSVPANTTAGAHIEVVLNAGDTGIRDITAVSVTGGTPGDRFNLESWNEGLGKTLSLPHSDANPVWYDIDPKRALLPIAHQWSLWHHFYQAALTNVVLGGTFPDAEYTLAVETVEPDYELNVKDFGFMNSKTTITKSNSDKKLRIDLLPNTSYTHIDSNEEATRMKWKWAADHYENVGFYKLTFDYDLEFSGSYFILELLDKNSTVVWSRTSTGAGMNQVVLFKSFAWEFRLRCVANYTTGASTTWHAQVTNIRIERYKDWGTAEQNISSHVPNLNHYDETLQTVNELPGTNAKFQLAFSDNDTAWSSFAGPDGTSATYFENTGDKITVPAGYTGYYYKWKVYLTSDGRDTPALYDLSVWMFVKIFQKLLELEKRLPYPQLPSNPVMPQALAILKACPRETPGYPAPPCPGGSYISETLSGQIFTGKIYGYIKFCARTTPGYPAAPCSGGTWMAATLSGYEWIGKYYSLVNTFLESVVGQVLSGYVRDQNENIIINGIKVIITSTYAVDKDQMGKVNKNTGFYQVFVKNTKYDGRYLIVELGGRTFNAAYKKYGNPALIDGTGTIASPQDLHFWKPDAICGKSIAFVGSLVTY